MTRSASTCILSYLPREVVRGSLSAEVLCFSLSIPRWEVLGGEGGEEVVRGSFPNEVATPPQVVRGSVSDRKCQVTNSRGQVLYCTGLKHFGSPEGIHHDTGGTGGHHPSVPPAQRLHGFDPAVHNDGWVLWCSASVKNTMRLFAAFRRGTTLT